MWNNRNSHSLLVRTLLWKTVLQFLTKPNILLPGQCGLVVECQSMNLEVMT